MLPLLGDLSVTVADRGATPADVDASDTVVNLASTAADVVVPWVAAGRSARGYLDACPTDHAHAVAGSGPGAPVVPGAGWFSAIGDALAVSAATMVVEPVRVDVTAWVPSGRSVLHGATPRERAEWWRAVREPLQVLRDGEVVTEPLAAERRLAWFARPVGPHHAASVPGTHWRTLPRVVPSLQTARSALAMRSWVAEVVQGIGHLSRRRTGDVARTDEVAGRGPDRGTADERWAVVVEVATAGGDLARAWAYGHDRHALTAHVVAYVAAAMQHTDVAGGPPRGVTELVGAQALLDDLAAQTDLRWSVTR